VTVNAFLSKEMLTLFALGATSSDTERDRQGRHSYDTNNDTKSRPPSIVGLYLNPPENALLLRNNSFGNYEASVI
jgi:hypothetical protein